MSNCNHLESSCLLCTQRSNKCKWCEIKMCPMCVDNEFPCINCKNDLGLTCQANLCECTSDYMSHACLMRCPNNENLLMYKNLFNNVIEYLESDRDLHLNCFYCAYQIFNLRQELYGENN